LSPQHRDDLADGCPMAASTSEIARQDEAISARFSEGFERTVEAIRLALGPMGNGAATVDARQRALAIAAATIGGIAAARAVSKARPDLSHDILTAMRGALGEVGGESPPPSAKPRGHARTRRYAQSAEKHRDVR